MPEDDKLDDLPGELDVESGASEVGSEIEATEVEMPEEEEADIENDPGDSKAQVEVLREVVKEEVDEEKESLLSKNMNKIVIGVLSLIIFLALFVFFKGGDDPEMQDAVEIEVPEALPPGISPRVSSKEDENNSDKKDKKEGETSLKLGEILVANRVSPELSQDIVKDIMIPIERDEFPFPPLEENEQASSESEEMLLVKKEKVNVEPEPAPEAPVLVEEKKPPVPGFFAIQLGAFKDETGANALRGRLDKKGYDAYVLASNDGLYRVRVGDFEARKKAKEVSAQIKKTNRLDSIIIKN